MESDAAASRASAACKEAWPTEKGTATTASLASTARGATAASAASAAIIAKATNSKWPLYAEHGAVEREVTALLYIRLASFVDNMEFFHEAQVVGGRMVLKPKPHKGLFDGFKRTETFFPDWYCIIDLGRPPPNTTRTRH